MSHTESLMTRFPPHPVHGLWWCLVMSGSLIQTLVSPLAVNGIRSTPQSCFHPRGVTLHTPRLLAMQARAQQMETNRRTTSKLPSISGLKLWCKQIWPVHFQLSVACVCGDIWCCLCMWWHADFGVLVLCSQELAICFCKRNLNKHPHV